MPQLRWQLSLGCKPNHGEHNGVESEPSNSSISNYGTMLYYTGRFEEAETQFRRAAEMSQLDHRLRGNVADALRHIDGRESEAIAEYEHAIRLAQQRLEVSRKDVQAIAAQAWYRACTGEGSEAAELIVELAGTP